MRKRLAVARFPLAMGSLVLFAALSSIAWGEDRFALAVGPHGDLVIFGPKGERAADLPVPSISQPITIEGITFQVSYGRDANDLLTAIITPNSNAPQDLHFNVLNKSVDADKQAVVTLTFSRSFDNVTVDPGYIGSVQVNSRELKHHRLSDDRYSPPHSSLASNDTLAPHTTANLAPREETPAPKPVYHPPAAPVAATTSSDTPSPVSSSAPASQPETTDSNVPASASADSTSMADLSSSPMSGNIAMPGIPLDQASAAATEVHRLFWSESVTPPNGVPPPVGIDQMKLVEVKGPVTIRTPDGETRTGQEGMTIPSGSTIQTADHASAAVFMGGVNSARLLPNTNLGITQHLDGAVRHTNIDLRDGTVFSRIGRRPGEKEDYQVSTPEGVAAARGTATCSSRHKGPDGKYHHYVFVIKGIVSLSMNGNSFKIVAGNGKAIGMGSMPPTADEKDVLLEVLREVQQFNVYLNAILDKQLNLLNGNSLTPGEIAYFNNQMIESVIFTNELNGLIRGPTAQTPIPDPRDPNTGNIENLQDIVPVIRRAINQEIRPFGVAVVTPY